MSNHGHQHRATFHPATGDPISRSFVTAADGIDWLLLQSPGADLALDTGTERWTASDPNGRLIGEVSRQKTG